MSKNHLVTFTVTAQCLITEDEADSAEIAREVFASFNHWEMTEVLRASERFEIQIQSVEEYP